MIGRRLCEDFRRGLQPDHLATAANGLAAFFSQDRAAAESNHVVRELRQIRDNRCFEVTKGLLPRARKDFLDGLPRPPLNFVIGVEPLPTE